MFVYKFAVGISLDEANFGQIPQLTAELVAIERMKNRYKVLII